MLNEPHGVFNRQKFAPEVKFKICISLFQVQRTLTASGVSNAPSLRQKPASVAQFEFWSP